MLFGISKKVTTEDKRHKNMHPLDPPHIALGSVEYAADIRMDNILEQVDLVLYILPRRCICRLAGDLNSLVVLVMSEMDKAECTMPKGVIVNDPGPDSVLSRGVGEAEQRGGGARHIVWAELAKHVSAALVIDKRYVSAF